MRLVDLYWLPTAADLSDRLRRLTTQRTPAWTDLVELAKLRLDFVQTSRIDKALQRCPEAPTAKTLRLAILSSSTANHLLGGCRIAALRRSFRLLTFVGPYGTYLQELESEGSELHQFSPDFVLCAFHPQHLLGIPDPALDALQTEKWVNEAADRIMHVWRLIQRSLRAQIIQQTILSGSPLLLGSNEHRLPGAITSMVERLNGRLRELADEYCVDVLDLDHVVRHDGLSAWHDPVLWHRAKQEISPAAAPAYGELVARLIAAQRGLSAKCLVLDLDNTLWGGAVGDDGLEGITLGQGSALGEAYLDFQHYVRALGRRGVILAVCSKNDIENGRQPFARHPEMALREEHIACFVCNWEDKATNLRRIATQLNIGTDALVFVDDNPFERNIVRRELTEVSVPEMPEDPAYYGRCLADAGYFEALHVTEEDFERGSLYRANAAREQLRASRTDLKGYLQSLGMELRWQPCDRVGLVRVAQLVNKTNQFNLTTRRYTDHEILAAMEDTRAMTLQLRLIDQFGDNGIIGVVIGKPEGDDLRIDTWLMSCRVLGRQVEEATLNIVVSEARRLKARNLIGEYLPTKKNAMVREHYRKLGFELAETADDGASTWRLAVADYAPLPTFIRETRST
jgi:FkbH-like protein